MEIRKMKLIAAFNLILLLCDFYVLAFSAVISNIKSSKGCREDDGEPLIHHISFSNTILFLPFFYPARKFAEIDFGFVVIDAES